MNKFYVLRDEATGKYFTDRWGKYWSAEIEEAQKFSITSDMDEEIDKLYEDNCAPLDGVTNIEVVKLYSKP